ncbi:MATE family efflux transporter [Cellulosilyticum sp. I15G10I2]|uniref:MATE family efflux transporter n=1 Tax=Cellulosilyticum sp. I15G10I2 TaxID=1892843 RepID=UPI00085BE19D|nr:MATE family efflux transporter [Cellulosilyticum sp. I15G10I2]
MDRQKELSEQSIIKLLVKYSIPAIIGMLVNALYNVVDRMFIGNIPGIGALAITGVGITMPIITIILAFALLISAGATASISIKLGQGKRDEAEVILGNAVSLSVLIGFILTILGIIFSGQLLMLFGGSENTIQYGITYIHIFLLGTTINLVGFALNHIMRADGSPKMAAIVMVSGCLLNIVLDALFIFVLGMGIAGAAAATIISQILTAILGIIYFTKGKSHLKIKKQNLKITLPCIKPILAIGSAPFMMQIAISLVQIITNNTLKATGEEIAIGAMTAIMSIMMLILMPLFGINQGAQPIIGYNYGAKNYQRSKKALLFSVLGGTIILIVGFIIIETMPNTLIRLFDGEGAMIDIAVPGLRIYASTMPILAVSIVGSNYFQAIGKAGIAMFLSLLRQVIVLIPMLFMLSSVWGLTGVWLAQPVSDIICTGVIAGFLLKEFNTYKASTQSMELESV